MTENRECGADAAAYVLGALGPDEADAFRRHLADCSVCHDEVAAFEQVVDALPMSTSQLTAPRGLRKRLMRTVRAEAKAADTATSRPVVGSRWPTIPNLSPAIAAAFAAVAVGAAVGGAELATGGSNSARTVAARVIGSPGTAELRVASGHAELTVNHFPPPPAGRIYEVWLKRRSGPLMPTRALFSVTATGAGDVGVPGDLRGVSEVLVTPEPDGGSAIPTHTPVIIARLT